MTCAVSVGLVLRASQRLASRRSLGTVGGVGMRLEARGRPILRDARMHDRLPVRASLRALLRMIADDATEGGRSAGT